MEVKVQSFILYTRPLSVLDLSRHIFDTLQGKGKGQYPPRADVPFTAVTKFSACGGKLVLIWCENMKDFLWKWNWVFELPAGTTSYLGAYFCVSAPAFVVNSSTDTADELPPVISFLSKACVSFRRKWKKPRKNKEKMIFSLYLLLFLFFFLLSKL